MNLERDKFKRKTTDDQPADKKIKMPKDTLLIEMTIKNFYTKIDSQNVLGRTRLMIAAGKGNEKVVDFYLKSGANVHVEDSNRCSVLMHAIESGNLNVVEKIVRAGGDVLFSNKYGESVLSLAQERVHLSGPHKKPAAQEILNFVRMEAMQVDPKWVTHQDSITKEKRAQAGRGRCLQ